MAFSVVRICDDPDVLARFCSSYVQSQVRCPQIVFLKIKKFDLLIVIRSDNTNNPASFQESDLISKLARRMNKDGYDSSDEEVSTPEKLIKGKEKVGDYEELDIVDLESLGKGVAHSVSSKNADGLSDGDAKVKRRLDDEFSTSCLKRKTQEVIVKKEKL